MVTVNKMFNIPPARGLGAFKMIHATFTDLGPLYASGGVEAVFPSYVKEVVAPIWAGCRSGGLLVEVADWSGRAVKLVLRNLPDPTTYSGTTANLAELASGTAISGVYSFDVAAICTVK